MERTNAMRGLSLVDVVVGTALFLVIFLGLFGILRASIAVTGLAKARAAATTLATSKMEQVRALDYDAVGTVGGIPAGTVAQNATSTTGGISFSVRTFIEYVDDAADGSGASDSNSITTDYKKIKVVVSYTVNNTARNVTLVSNMVPPGIETTTGGGTIRVSVVNASGVAVPGATVRIVNASTSPTIDVTTFSDSTGIVYLPGAPTSTQYQVYVSKSNYSSAQTYSRTVSNPNPTPGYLTVAQNQTTTGTFAIDTLATLILRTYRPPSNGVSTDTFTDATGLTTLTNVAVSGGAVVLTGAPGTYSASGNAKSIAIAPTDLSGWVNASSTRSLPTNTTLTFHVGNAAGTLIPDTALAGNAAGFTGLVDLSGLATSTYPSLTLIADLTSSDVNVTPSLLWWGVGYTKNKTPLANASVSLRGAKTIGSTSAGASIYKTTVATTTDSTGVRTLSLEWDLYATTTNAGFTVITEDPDAPYELLPGTTVDASIIMTTP